VRESDAGAVGDAVVRPADATHRRMCARVREYRGPVTCAGSPPSPTIRAHLADFSAVLPREADASYCACSGDFDGNGRLDLFVGAADVDRVLLNQTP
jgi:hypothetical protein